MPHRKELPGTALSALGLLRGPALLAVMEAAAARLGVQLIRQFPAKEQAELKVKVQIYARLAFCCRVHESGAELPTPCFRSLGAKVVGSRSEQWAWASHLLHGVWANATVVLDSPPIPAVLASLAGEDLSPIIERGACW